MENTTLTDDELLIDFAYQSLQLCKLDERIEQLMQLREKLSIKHKANFKIYEDRLRKLGKEIDMPKPDNIDELLKD